MRWGLAAPRIPCDYVSVEDPDMIEGSYRVKDQGEVGPWSRGEPVLRPNWLGNLLAFLFLIGLAWLLFHWLAAPS